ncbi:MAG TPA: divalent metal cation transporter [Candidatus Eubacterium pullicola]|uniref:Divalent metal cation transporter n=1 Tax=Gallibacter intestinalis TaxID=2779356 RepID=A0ABR9QWW8_9FIRM|nr:NRAMP family divalent metal transporter [Gallibacter intestinalis]MBE5035364.1 divalent metal cation transporter [Gallibacter intestinalis]HIW39506.1 divalent metal cation transporter [Candidatus Eubacterium pullicola]
MGKNKENKKSAGVLLGAAFLMATSAIGPGFLTQTGQFTGELKASFGFVILISVILAAIVQLNVWRVLCVSGLRGQDVANKVLPGLGYLVAFLIVAGGLVFNIGNVGGGALGFNTLLGLPEMVGYFLAGGIAVVVFLIKNAMSAMDNVTKVLGGLMIVVIFVVILIVRPPVGMALKETVMPTAAMGDMFPAILTLLGGTVGGYITFAGAHRLIDAGITGENNLGEINKSSLMGMGIAAIVRVFLFLAILGVVVETATSAAHTLDPSNPAADAFRIGAGELGYRFFGLVLLAASITSIIGCAYTSISFLKTFSKKIADNENKFIVAFIVISTIVMAFLGQPAALLVLAGALNGLILPITLGVCLIAAKKKSIMGEDYKHPAWLLILGIVVVIASAYLGVTSLGSLGQLFA